MRLQELCRSVSEGKLNCRSLSMEKLISFVINGTPVGRVKFQRLFHYKYENKYYNCDMQNINIRNMVVRGPQFFPRL